ncbi:MFS transporter [Rhizobium sp. Root1204]|uniref:MFS transporter n=1 Tax=Rhizobium sp. Root1204 TaxID=1736428 RepID=UPI0007130004|nr:MFS transporter [Rhizobium sp. Root1204]KQV41300.1 hypothetical protein ASC96_18575 [Rhizobium sp. Root1204]
MTTLDAEASTGGLGQPARSLAISAVLIAFNLSTLMVSIANVALPTIAKDLGIQPADAIWIITIYQLAVIAFLLPISSLADIIGYRPIYLAGLFVFVCGSAVCGMSGWFETVLFGRFLQGLGAAAIQGVYVYSMAHIFPRHLVGQGVGLGTLTSQITAMLAPTIAGAILLFAPWNWLFLLVVPIGIVALGVSQAVLPSAKGRARKLDIVPVVLNVLSFGMLMLGLERVLRSPGKMLWGTVIAMAVLLGAIQIWMQRRSATPLIPADLFRNPAFSLTMMTTFFSFAASGVALVALPFYLQNVLHFTPQLTGLFLSAWPISAAASGLVMGWWFRDVSPGRVGAAGLVTMALGLIALALLPENPSHPWIAICLAAGGLGFGAFVTPNVKAIIMMVPLERSGAASGMQGVSRLFGQSLGAIIVAVALAGAGVDWSMYALSAAATLAVLGAITSALRRIAQV